MFITTVLTFVAIIAGCFVYCWGHTNGYRDACHKYRTPRHSKDINILYPL